jgi:hypothetical protein
MINKMTPEEQKEWDEKFAHSNLEDFCGVKFKLNAKGLIVKKFFIFTFKGLWNQHVKQNT